jgi:hypothetical protein
VASDPTEFGYLDTDEEVPGGKRVGHEFDRLMFSGCVSFTLLSALQFAAVFVPFATARSLHTHEDLYRILAVAYTASFLFGAAGSWIGKVAGFCGSVAGLVPAGVFVWFRLAGATTGMPGIEGYEPAEFPPSFAWALPVAHGVTFGILWYIVLRLALRTEPRSDAPS